MRKIRNKKVRQTAEQLQKVLGLEMKRLLKDGHSEKLSELTDDVYIQPTLITAKKDRSVKIVLDAIALNQSIEEDKYKMSYLENQLVMIAGKLDSEKREE